MYTDFVIQLKNAAMARKKELRSPYANINKAIAQVLVKEGFLETVKEDEVDGRKMLLTVIRFQRRKPAITGITIVSKPSLRVYVATDEIARKQGRSAVAVLSTSAGILPGRKAIKQKVGGELLFKIW